MNQAHAKTGVSFHMEINIMLISKYKMHFIKKCQASSFLAFLIVVWLAMDQHANCQSIF